MGKFAKSLLILSLMSAFIACEKEAPAQVPEPPKPESEPPKPTYPLAAVNSVSEPSESGLRTISLLFNLDADTELTMDAVGAFKHLEAGYYDIQAIADERLEATVALKVGGTAIDVSGGEIYVVRKNNEYKLKWTLATALGERVYTLNGKEILFEYDTFTKLTSGGTGEIQRDLEIESEILNMTMKYSICFPDTYDGTREYPVLYMLHGMDGNNNDWFNGGPSGGSVNAYASEFFREGGREMIIVSPEARNSFYSNGYIQGMDYMTYFFEEFIPFIEDKYPIRSERGSRAIAGLSMGGYGTMYYGFLHPEMFCYMYACSAGTASGRPETPSLRQYMIAAKDEGRLAELPGLTMEIGTEDSLCYSANQQFVGVLSEYSIAYEYITRPGVHYWSFWNECCPKILRKVAAAFE